MSQIGIFRGVFEQLLGGVLSNKQLDKVMVDTEEQIRYSLERFAAELVEVGYTKEYAVTTATQIIPKPFLYSALIAYRVMERPAELVDLFTQVANWDRDEFRSIQYVLVAPVILVYLFDQTIDNYNRGPSVDTVISTEISRAAKNLFENPCYYHDTLKEVVSYMRDHDGATPDKLPDHLKPYWLFAVYCRSMMHMPVDDEEILAVAHTIADVISYEHIGALAYNKGCFSGSVFPVIPDFIDQAVGLRHNHLETSVEASVRAGLRNQGFMLITTLLHIQMRIFVEQYYHEGKGSFIQSFVRSGLVPYLRMYEVIVRVGDDLGDFYLDRRRGALNFFVRGDELLDNVVRLLDLYVSDVTEGQAIGEFLELVQQVSLHVQEEDSSAGVIRAMCELRERFYAATIAYVDGLPGDEFDQDTKKQYRFIIRIIDGIIEGAIINAAFNDRSAEELGRMILSVA